MTTAHASQERRRRAGRPRSMQAERAIINAALDEFAEAGPQGLAIEKVAAKAGVGKATIYRRWPGKEELLLDAISAMRTELPEPKGESVREDLAALLDAMGRESADPRWARQFALLLGDGAAYPRLLERYLDTVVEPRREIVRNVLRRGVATGELREETNIEAAVDLLTGAVIARPRSGKDRVDRGYARRIVDELLIGLASR
ncbi:MAG TPA: TetR/AcrR family transcriptional regulator [Streptosporangiaceae bacterium]|nr:TetR/AcrR family transcriptional regulator [Streptosporangiaceae bacterium]